MKDTRKVRFNVTDRMQRTVDEVVSSSVIYRSKKHFAEKSIDNQVSDMMEMLSGYKDLSYFIKDLNEDIRWINIQRTEVSFNSKLIKDKSLSSQLLVNLSEDTHSIVRRASNITSLPKSDIMRVCMLKELYHMGDEYLNPVKYRRVSDRWLMVSAKLNNSTRILVDQLRYNLDIEPVKKKLEMESEIHNLTNIAYHYRDFKDSSGYETMSKLDSGKAALEILEQIGDRVHH